MNRNTKHTNEPDENLAIGRIIEVDGSRIIAELDSGIQELSRIYAGEAYQIGQFGSMVKIHFGRRTIYALVALLRMKAEYEQERGMVAVAATDERVVEADLFGKANGYGIRPAPTSWCSKGELALTPCHSRRYT